MFSVSRMRRLFCEEKKDGEGKEGREGKEGEGGEGEEWRRGGKGGGGGEGKEGEEWRRGRRGASLTSSGPFRIFLGLLNTVASLGLPGLPLGPRDNQILVIKQLNGFHCILVWEWKSIIFGTMYRHDLAD